MIEHHAETDDNVVVKHFCTVVKHFCTVVIRFYGAMKHFRIKISRFCVAKHHSGKGVIRLNSVNKVFGFGKHAFKTP